MERKSVNKVDRQTVRVVHLTSVHRPNDNRIFHKECRTLAEAGYEVTLVAPGDKHGVVDGVKIKSVPRCDSRLARMLVTTWHVFRAGLAEKGDIYHFHDPELIPFGLLLRLSGRRVIYDVHEDYVTSISQKRYLPRPVRKTLARVFGWLENLSSKAFRLVLAERYYLRRFPTGTLILNYPRLDFFRFDDSAPVNQDDLQNVQPALRRLIYTGGVTVDRGALIYARMVAEIPDIEVTVVGYCPPALAQQMRVTAGHGASRLKIIGEGRFVPFEEIATIYRSGLWTAGLAIFPRTPHYVQKELTKFFEYMAAGIPIICSNFPVWRELVAENGVGVCVDPDDIKSIRMAIDALSTDRNRAMEMGKRGRDLVLKRFNWEVEGRKLVEFYDNLAVR